jgi:hypothetical protein
MVSVPYSSPPGGGDDGVSSFFAVSRGDLSFPEDFWGVADRRL